MSKSTNYFGIDISKDVFDVTTEKQVHHQFPNTNLVAWRVKRATRVFANHPYAECLHQIVYCLKTQKLDVKS